MNEIGASGRVRVGINSAGDANIEVWTGDRDEPDSQCEEIFVPRNEVQELATWLLRHA